MAQKKEEEKISASPEKVTVFNEEVDQNRWRSPRHHGGGVWGLLFLVAGVLLLLNSLGFLPWYVWDYIWRFWPVLLIVIGLQIMLGDSPTSRFVITIITIFLILFVLFFAVSQVNSGMISPFQPGGGHMFFFRGSPWGGGQNFNMNGNGGTL